MSTKDFLAPEVSDSGRVWPVLGRFDGICSVDQAELPRMGVSCGMLEAMERCLCVLNRVGEDDQ